MEIQLLTNRWELKAEIYDENENVTQLRMWILKDATCFLESQFYMDLPFTNLKTFLFQFMSNIVRSIVWKNIN